VTDPVIRTPDQRLRVYVSSDLEELKEEREAARGAITSLRLTPIVFESGGRPHPPRDLYRSYIAQSHIFIGIYGTGYGWMAPDSDISGIEDEFRIAGDMPRLVYVKNAASRDPRLETFIRSIGLDERVSLKRFETASDVRSTVQDDLALLLTERFEPGGEPDGRPATVAGPALHALPVPPTRFIGREAEEEELVRLLERDDPRLVTLTGPGGIGKSRLAISSATKAEAAFPDGIAFVTLAPIHDHQSTVPAIAQALGVAESAERSLLENVEEYLRDRKTLLLLDNFEHVLSSAPAISELLAACPSLKVMITSRAGLRLRGEYEFIVPPLATPGSDGRLRPEELMDLDAVKLFVERAEAANPRFELTEANAAAVAEICSRLDGLPLALELAAARTKLLPPPAMLTRLTNRLQLLTGGPRDLPERQQTLRATLDWDYDLLSETEQKVFRTLAVFAGGFTLTAADEVLLSLDTDIDVLDAVESLVGKSLLGPVSGAHPEPRFVMLKTIREYAVEKLDESDEGAEARDRHAHYFLRLAERAAPKLKGPEQVHWLEVLAAEHDNLRAALRRMAAEGNAEVELRLAGALARFWEFRSFLSEGQHWLEDALQRASDAPPELRATCLEGAGVLALGQGELKRAATLMDSCVALRRQLGDEAALATSIKNLGNVAYVRGDYARAKVLFEESRALKEKVGDIHGVAEATNNLGVLAGMDEHWDEAEALYNRALDAFRIAGDRQGTGRTLMNLAEVKNVTGDHEAAGPLLKESIMISREIGSRWDLCDLFEESGRGLVGRGRPMEATRLFGAATALRELLGTPLPAGERTRYERSVELAREALGEDAFRTAWDEGLAMDHARAVDYALAV
jgi:predicted ATPase